MGNHLQLECLLLAFTLVYLFARTMSAPSGDKVINKSKYMRWNEGRIRRAVNFDECEFGSDLMPYDEDCPNGARSIIPCNPGQLKVAECIGQNGDTTRMCEPCPQKSFQKYYNKCTKCHTCSDCGENEEIKVACTDETDTVCVSAILPGPVPTLAPATETSPSTTPSLASTQSTAMLLTTSQNTSSAGPITTPGLTKEPVLSTTSMQQPVPVETFRGCECTAIVIVALFLIVSQFAVITVLFNCVWRQKQMIVKLMNSTNEPTSSEEPTCLPMFCSTKRETVTSDDFDAIPLKGISEGQSNDSSDGPKPVAVASPIPVAKASPSPVPGPTENPGSAPLESESEVETPLKICQPSDARDSPRSSPGLGLNEPPHEKFLVQVNASHEGSVESLDTSQNGEVKEGMRNSLDSNERSACGELFSDVGKDGCGTDDGKEPKCTKTVVQAELHSSPVHRVGGSPNTTDSRRNSSANSNNSRQTAHSSTADGSIPGDADSSVVTGAENSSKDAMSDSPKTLVSTNHRPEKEHDESDRLMPQITQPSPSPGTVPDPKKAKKRNNRDQSPSSKFWKRKKPKNEQGLYTAVPQEESFSSKADNMVTEKFLDDLAGRIDLKTLDKLCRELGREEKDVSNLRVTHQQEHGSELAFKMLMSIRATLGTRFTFKLTIQAMRRSRNEHLVKDFVNSYGLR